MAEESPLILSEAAKTALKAEFDKKKAEFDKKLVQLMVDNDIAVVPKLHFTNRGIFSQIDFEPLEPKMKELMLKKIS